MRLNQLARTIQFAQVRCLAINELIDRIANLDEDDPIDAYVHRLSEAELSHAEQLHLIGAMNHLAQRSENSPSSLKAKLDRTLLRIVRLLPSELANSFAEPFVGHRLKSRRQWAYFALRKQRITQSNAVKLLKVFQDHTDQDALILIARNPVCVSEIGADVLLSNLEDEYWRARVIECLILQDHEAAVLASLQYPVEFAHACGRTKDQSMLGQLEELFEHNQCDSEFISMYAYALGKLQAKEQLKALEEFVASGCSPSKLG